MGTGHSIRPCGDKRMVEEQAPLFPTKEQEQLYNKFKYYYKHYWGVDRVEVLKRLINTKGIREMIQDRGEIEWR
jgi:hypothetical protein